MIPGDVTPAVFCKHEEFWIHYVLRDLFKVFGRVVMLDTGSRDATVDIAKETARKLGGELTLLLEDYGDNKYSIGNAPNVLRSAVTTNWMLLIGGDEIWPEDQLQAMLQHGMPAGTTVGMVTGRNVTSDNGRILERDGFSADRLFDRSIIWGKVDYPFEGHGLQQKSVAGLTHYIPACYWHMRHLFRSSLDNETYYRGQKAGYFPWNGELKEMPANWLGELANFPNPYLRG